MRRKIYPGLLAFLIFLVIILANTLFIFYDTSFVHNEFEKLGVDVSNATKIDREIRDYLVGDKQELNTDFLNEKEKRHLDDVKRLFTLGKILLGLFVLIIAVIIFEMKGSEMPKTGIFLGGFFVAFTCLALIVLNFFDTSFIIFHKLFFTNDLWMMTPHDNIIQLYPQQFFMNTFGKIVKRSVVWLVIAIGLFNLKYIWKLILKIKKYFSFGQGKKTKNI
ncbi:MAG: DUF1461 domain-containing protein [Nanoarchaeota archaeon]